MKSIYLFFIFALSGIACSRSHTTHHSPSYYQKLSTEIEGTSYQYASTEVISEQKTDQFVMASNVREKEVYITPKIIQVEEPVVVVEKRSPRSIKKIQREHSWRNVRDNMVWKVGYSMLMAGLAIIVISGVILKTGWGVGAVFTFLLGVAVMALSLPLLLIGLLIGNKSTPPPSGPDDPVN